MRTLPGVLWRGLIWNAVPFVLTWLLLTVVTAGSYNAGFESTVFETQLGDEPGRLFMTISSVVVGLLGTLAVAIPVVFVDFWSRTNRRSLQMLAILPLIAAELLVGAILDFPLVLVSLFGFLQWVYWTFVWFARDTSPTPPNSPTEPETAQAQQSAPGPSVQSFEDDEPEPVIGLKPKELELELELDTDTTIENLEASMADLASQIMKEKET